MASAWTNAKNAKIARNGAVCEICGREGVVGHHITPRHRKGQDCVDNCQIRCVACENWAHGRYKDGNPPEVAIQRRREYYKHVR